MRGNTILATGADIKNRFLFAKGSSLFPGPDIGDLSDVANYERFREEAALMARRMKMAPGVVVCDIHPGYFSTKFAKDGQPWFAGKYRLIQVQHHHAHIASVMCEHKLEGPVIGVSFDGTGFGTDGNVWGGEFLLVDKKDFKRAGYLKYRMMPGGDKVIFEPWRMVLSILGTEDADMSGKMSGKDKDLVMAMISKGINSPLTSSAGRIFDAAAALLGVCVHASYEAEGPMKLEAMCEEGVEESYGFDISNDGDCDIVDAKGLFLGMIRDMRKGDNKNTIATRFHNSMKDVVVKEVKRISKREGIKDVVLSGGVFQNNFLKTKTIKALTCSGFKVFINEANPANDLNIALGQYYVALMSTD